MSIYKKLQDARVKLQAVEMTKTGKNTFAKYSYFELGDFLPHINKIFNEVGLCGVISFTTETATLEIHDTETDKCITITSPMVSAEVKGALEIQRLGAAQTYQRRYLWMAALEIVEHDAIDAVEQQKPAANKPSIKDYQAMLQNTKTLSDLKVAWDDVPAQLKPQLEHIKNTMKDVITSEQKAA